MNITQFENYGTPNGNIAFLFEPLIGGVYAVSASNISTTACGFENVADALEELETVQFTFDNILYQTNIINKVDKDQYFFFLLEPFLIPAQSNNPACSQVLLNPGLGGAGFTNSDYNPLFNNASEIRSSVIIQDVDRKREQKSPSNLTSILQNTATKATVQDSNYSSLSVITGRYLGSKTSVDDYGVEPIVGATYFEGSLYTTEKENTRICSQSFGERTVEGLLFSLNVDGIQTNTATETPKVRYQAVMDKATASTNFSQTDTEFTINQNVNTEPGDILRMYNGTELMKVVAVDKPNTFTTIIKVERAYYGEYITYTPANWTANSTPLLLVKILGDTIYTPEAARPYKVTNKKLWVQETEEVLVIDSRGIVISKEITCI